MSKQEQETPQKSISEPETLEAIIARLSRDQLRFVAAMQEYRTKREAAEAIGLKPNTVYGWNSDIDTALEIIAQDRVSAAREIATKNLIKAMMVKVHGLDSNDEGIRQRASTEIIEMEFGKPIQKQEHSGPDGRELIFRVIYGDDGVQDQAT